jgi:hypothetical protein
LAAVGERAGADLWHYETPDGRSIRKALMWIVPYAKGDKDWTWKELKKIDWASYYSLFVQAYTTYHDASCLDLAKKIGGDAMLEDRSNILYGAD